MDLTTTEGTFRNQQGERQPDLRVAVRLTREDIDDGELISPETVIKKTDSDGHVSFDLWPNERGEKDSRYELTVRDPSGRVVLYGYFTLPDTDQVVDLMDELEIV